MFINVNGTWKSISDIFLNVSGTWKRIVDGFINVAGTWKRFLSSALSIAQQVTISQSTNATTFLTTLTGTNYYWSPGPPVLTYKFQRSTNGGTTWSDLDSDFIVNPAFGSSNTKTYSLASSGPTLGVLPNVLNYYRFRVDATYGSLTAESISSSTTIQGPTNVTIGLSSSTFASIQLSWTASTGASRYLVYRSTDNITFSQYASVTSTSLSGISDLAGGGTYYFYVVPITGGSFTYPGYLGNNSNTLVLPILATPTLSSATSQSGGFFFTINNYDASNTYVLSTTSGSISRSGSLVTVSGLSSGASATATVRATRSGYGDSASATRTGSALSQYTISWNANGGSVSPSSNTVNSGTNVSAPTPTRAGYTFLYWRDTPSGGYSYQINAGGSWNVTSNITFYARWSVTPIIPTITMGANSGVTQTTGTINWTSTNQVSFSSTGTFSATGSTATSISKTGLTGSTNYTGTVTVTSSTGHTASTNYSLTTSPIQYTVTWNANGGSVSPSSNTVNAGGSVTAPTPTRSGFNFVRWTNTPSGDYFYTVLAGGSFTPPSSITMYARWTSAGTSPATPTNGGGSYSQGTNYITNATFTRSGTGTTPITYHWSAEASTSSSGPWTLWNSGTITSSTLSGTQSIPQQAWNQALYGNWARYKVYATNGVNPQSGTLEWLL
jgi:hypothetical protein